MFLLQPEADRTVYKPICVRPTLGGGAVRLPTTYVTAPGNPGLPPGSMPAGPGVPVGGGGGGGAAGGAAVAVAKEALACSASGVVLAAAVGLDAFGLSSVFSLAVSAPRAIATALGVRLWDVGSAVNGISGSRMATRLSLRASSYAGGYAAQTSAAAIDVYARNPAAISGLAQWQTWKDASPFMTPRSLETIHELCPRGVTGYFR
jgi:hypothetical protein